MGFITGCFLVAMMAKAVWDFVTKPASRNTMLAEYVQRPISTTFIMVWMTFFLMFFVGIFVPVFGKFNLTEDGWQVWEVGGFGSLGMWIVTWLVEVEKMDRK